MRDSGEIEQEADAVIFHGTAETNLSKTRIKLAVYLAKYRQGSNTSRGMPMGQGSQGIRGDNITKVVTVGRN